MARRVLFMVLLVYVAVDLSVPAMPGAFVFDGNASVRGRAVRSFAPHDRQRDRSRASPVPSRLLGASF